MMQEKKKFENLSQLKLIIALFKYKNMSSAVKFSLGKECVRDNQSN